MLQGFAVACDLEEILRILQERNVAIHDPQFLIGEDGRVVIHDPLAMWCTIRLRLILIGI